MGARFISIWMLGLVLMLPHHAYASFMPAHLIDGFANVVSWVVLIVLPIAFIALFWFVKANTATKD